MESIVLHTHLSQLIDECPSERLIFLTEQTSLDDLDAALCQSLSSLFDATLVEIEGHHSEALTEDLQYAPLSKFCLGFDGHICETTSRPPTLSTDSSASEDTDGINVCVREANTRPSQKELQQLLRVYQNQEFHLTRSTQDKLTNLLNRQAYSEKMDHLFRSKGYNQRATDIGRVMAMVDIDRFKSINDQYGHLFGDEILVLISRLMEKTFRVDDWLIRFGGEEFIIILHGADLKSAEFSLNRFRESVAKFSFPQVEKVTISIGFTLLNLSIPHTQLLGRTDQALYYSKEHGRNQCHSFEALLEDNLLEEIDHDADIELFEHC